VHNLLHHSGEPGVMGLRLAAKLKGHQKYPKLILCLTPARKFGSC
jgi:hypothetical protein